MKTIKLKKHSIFGLTIFAFIFINLNISLKAIDIEEDGTWTTGLKPIYVGQESYLRDNSVFFGFFDIPTKKRSGRDQGNIAGFSLQYFKPLSSYSSWSIKLPAYTATSNATGIKADTNIGNLSGTIKWSKETLTNTGSFCGYGIAADLFLPTARQREAGAVAYSTPTQTFLDYSPFTTSIHPRAGIFMGRQYWFLKSDLGYAYQYISKDSYAIRGKNRSNFTWQSAASWHLVSFANLNLEYNVLVMGYKNADPGTVYRHALVPSLSGKIGSAAGNLFISIPLDQPSRDISTFAFGLKMGLVF
ncbi:MAG: hypothetical protein JWQ35_2323 [Bacteriovoracaceae bacterium]|nr:hypothetical protein [Bacteriovoracaceae bacterium]